MRWVANIAIVAAALVILAGPLNRVGIGFQVALGLMAIAALVGGLMGLISLVGALLARRRGKPAGRMVTGAIAGLGAFAILALFFVNARGVPPIHDITTDTQDPPQFVAVLPARGADSNPVDYKGAEIAALQTKAYPAVRTLVLDVPPAQAFQKALTAAGAMGWEVVAAVPEQGRLEATATTAWFGFKDDVVVRIRPQDAGSRVDVRSTSRVGVSDVGANAKRILAFLDEMQK
ncbi:MAG: DUF1499 domain-containing protein [Alphaproteobacteria bacterium]|nr:DUF1499 domain-containing protein [Alphaproteobacteria bacterium]